MFVRVRVDFTGCIHDSAFLCQKPYTAEIVECAEQYSGYGNILTQPDLDNLGFSAAAASSAVRGFGSSDDGG